MSWTAGCSENLHCLPCKGSMRRSTEASSVLLLQVNVLIWLLPTLLWVL
jgi:hypothetical protein